MLRANSPSAISRIERWSIPAPAPCANTYAARAFGGASQSPETLCSASIAMVTGWASIPDHTNAKGDVATEGAYQAP